MTSAPLASGRPRAEVFLFGPGLPAEVEVKRGEAPASSGWFLREGPGSGGRRAAGGRCRRRRGRTLWPRAAGRLWRAGRLAARLRALPRRGGSPHGVGLPPLWQGRREGHGAGVWRRPRPGPGDSPAPGAPRHGQHLAHAPHGRLCRQGGRGRADWRHALALAGPPPAAARRRAHVCRGGHGRRLCRPLPHAACGHGLCPRGPGRGTPSLRGAGAGSRGVPGGKRHLRRAWPGKVRGGRGSACRPRRSRDAAARACGPCLRRGGRRLRVASVPWQVRGGATASQPRGARGGHGRRPPVVLLVLGVAATAAWAPTSSRPPSRAPARTSFPGTGPSSSR